MGRKSSTSNTASTSTTNNPADAWLRLEVVDASGNRHRLPRDLAMQLKNHIHAQLIKNCDGGTKEFNLVGTVHVVDKAPKEDIAF